MENQKLNDQLEAFRKLNKENYNNIRKQIFELKQAVDKNFNRSGSEGEAVKEKEYTILSFIAKDGKVFNINGKDNYLCFDYSKNVPTASGISEEIGLKAYSIHSVRRESDGEIFTLGDKLVYGYDTEVIIRFSALKEAGMVIYFENGVTFLPTARKAPIRKPILITEDGVEIFEPKDTSEGMVFSVRTDAFIEKRIWVKDAIGCGFLWKHFSTKEKAEEYIKWNKPMYSLKDIGSIIILEQEALISLINLKKSN
jgi:hypothetical protein